MPLAGAMPPCAMLHRVVVVFVGPPGLVTPCRTTKNRCLLCSLSPRPTTGTSRGAGRVRPLCSSALGRRDSPAGSVAPVLSGTQQTNTGWHSAPGLASLLLSRAISSIFEFSRCCRSAVPRYYAPRRPTRILEMTRAFSGEHNCFASCSDSRDSSLRMLKWLE